MKHLEHEKLMEACQEVLGGLRLKRGSFFLDASGFCNHCTEKLTFRFVQCCRYRFITVANPGAGETTWSFQKYVNIMNSMLK